MTNIFVKFLFVSLLFINFSKAENINLFEFTDNELQSLEVRKVRGADNKTKYSLGSNKNGNYLKAVADNAASGLGKKIDPYFLGHYSINLNIYFKYVWYFLSQIWNFKFCTYFCK